MKIKTPIILNHQGNEYLFTSDKFGLAAFLKPAKEPVNLPAGRQEISTRTTF
jgi:hypothetical protein